MGGSPSPLKLINLYRLIVATKFSNKLFSYVLFSIRLFSNLVKSCRLTPDCRHKKYYHTISCFCKNKILNFIYSFSIKFCNCGILILKNALDALKMKGYKVFIVVLHILCENGFIFKKIKFYNNEL